MNQKIKYVGLLVILPLAMVALSPDFIGKADAAIQGFVPHLGTNFNEVYYLSDHLISPRIDKSFGVAVVGDYLITVNFDEVKIVADFYSSPSQGMMLEGWLVNSDNESYFSIGKFDKENNMLKFYQKDIEPNTYDLFIVTEESLSDTDSSDHQSIGRALISMKISAESINIGR